MALKAVLKSLDGLADAIKELYKKDGEDFRLEVEGMVPKSQLDEFRDSNVELKKKNEQLTADLKKWDGIDHAKVKEAQELERQVKEGQLVKAGKLDELKASWLEPIKSEFTASIESLKQSNANLTAQLESMQIDGELSKIAGTKGIRPTAVEDMISRGRRIFKLKDGKVVALAQDGSTMTTKTGDPMTMTAWLEQLAGDAPHLFQPSTGGGAPPGGPPPPAGAKVMTRTQFNSLGDQAKSDFLLKEKGAVVDA